jgi:6-pyruvoyltetrahydropterin/6-carboxytetrahydropterin synthase
MGDKHFYLTKVIYFQMDKRVAVYRKEHFNAAHRLHNDEWDDATNARIFGKCNLPHFHGHNYELIVKLTGVPDPATGYVMDTKLLSDIIKEKVLDRFDHRNLNLDTVEFKHLNPTAENISIVIYELLRPVIDQAHDLKVILFETPRNFVEYPA